jgi:hypothetical protein
MKQTLLVRLDTTKEQLEMLGENMHRFNQACNFIAPIAFKYKTANKMSEATPQAAL